MIRFRLQCQKEHGFDVWFRNGEDCERQMKRGLVACPECGATKIEKALMAPSVATSERKRAARIAKVRSEAAAPPAEQTPVAPAAAPTAPSPPMPPQQMARMAMQRELMAAMRKVREEVLAKAENVGEKFAEEARKIHYEETPARGIYGKATMQDAKALAEEGIEVFPLPPVPEDHN